MVGEEDHTADLRTLKFVNLLFNMCTKNYSFEEKCVCRNYYNTKLRCETCLWCMQHVIGPVDPKNIMNFFAKELVFHSSCDTFSDMGTKTSMRAILSTIKQGFEVQRWLSGESHTYP